MQGYRNNLYPMSCRVQIKHYGLWFGDYVMLTFLYRNTVPHDIF